MRDPRDRRHNGGMMRSPAWRSGLEYAGWLYRNDPEYRARRDQEKEKNKEKSKEKKPKE